MNPLAEREDYKIATASPQESQPPAPPGVQSAPCPIPGSSPKTKNAPRTSKTRAHNLYHECPTWLDLAREQFDVALFAGKDRNLRPSSVVPQPLSSRVAENRWL